MMKRVLVKKGMIGLVFKNGDYIRFIGAGSHWVGYKEVVKVYNLFYQFVPPVELDLLLEDTVLAAKLHILEVKDNQIAMHYENGVFQEILGTGRYSFWKGSVNRSFDLIDLGTTDEITGFDVNLLQRTSVSAYIRQFVIEPYEKGLLFVDGEFERVLEAGTYRFWKNAISMTLTKVDVRQQQMEVSGQEILTKDKAALRVNFFVHYKVKDVKQAVIESKNFENQLYILMQFALREFIGTLSLDELLEKKDEVGTYVLKNFKSKAKGLGVELIEAGIRDVILPGEIKEIMNQVLVAQKKAQANIITRREETASTRSLLNTAKLMEDNAMLFKLKEMEYVEKIAEKIGEITVSGGSNAVDQLKQIFSSDSK